MSITDQIEIPDVIWVVVGHKTQNEDTMASTDKAAAAQFATSERKCDSDVRAVRYRLDEEAAS